MIELKQRDAFISPLTSLNASSFATPHTQDTAGRTGNVVARRASTKIARKPLTQRDFFVLNLRVDVAVSSRTLQRAATKRQRVVVSVDDRRLSHRQDSVVVTLTPVLKFNDLNHIFAKQPDKDDSDSAALRQVCDKYVKHFRDNVTTKVRQVIAGRAAMIAALHPRQNIVLQFRRNFAVERLNEGVTEMLQIPTGRNDPADEIKRVWWPKSFDDTHHQFLSGKAVSSPIPGESG